MIVTIRPTEQADEGALFAAKNHPEVLASIPGTYPLDPTEFHARVAAEVAAGICKAVSNYTIVVDGAVAGRIGHFHRTENAVAEVGYLLGRDWWGRGVMTQALELLLVEVRELGVQELQGTHAPGNDASGRVLKKAGFVRAGEVPFTIDDGTVVMDLVWKRAV